MARVLVATQSWGVLFEREADRSLKVPAAGVLAVIDTVVFAAVSGGTVIDPEGFVTSVDGALPGYVEEGAYSVSVGGAAALLVQASSGSAGSRADDAVAAVDAEQERAAAAEVALDARSDSLESGDAWSGRTAGDVLTIPGSGPPTWETPSGGSGSGTILAWVTGHAYAQGQPVTNGGHTYLARNAHTSGATFAGDLAAHWDLLPLTAADVGADASGAATAAIVAHVAATDPHGDRAYADTLIAANDALVYKGVIDASASPNYPAASAGHLYKISVAGKIGGASGPNVEVGDSLLCTVDGTAAGTQAAVGSAWSIIQTNIDGAVIGPASSVSGNLAVFSGTGGKLLQDAGVAIAALDRALVRTAVRTANFTFAAGDEAPVDLTAGSVVGTLPTAPADKSRVLGKVILPTAAGANTLTIACGGSDTINRTGGATSTALVLPGQSALLQYDAGSATWTIQAVDLPLTQLDARYILASQKGAVNGVATLDATGKVPAGQVPVVRPIPAVGARSFLPNGVKLRGGNLTVKPSYPLTNDGFVSQGAWGKYYLDWDWTGWIKPQIDKVIAEGGNAIRQIGDIFGLKLGYYTEATYLAHWKQLIEYAAANNLYVYATGGSELHFGGATYAEAAGFISSYASFVNQYPNVIALDVLQEIPDTTSTRVANLKIVRDACKAANPNLPMTFSLSSVNGLSAAAIQALDPIVDYFDGHSYSTQSEASLNLLPGNGFNTGVNPKPLMVGEFGLAQSNVSSLRVAHAKSIRDWLARHPSVIGCFYWTMGDQDVSGASSNTWGLYTNARTTLNNGGPLTLPAATIPVVSTAGAGTQDNPAFPASGTFELGGFTITYTGITATTFTGCTGGTGAIPDGSPIYVRRSDVSDIIRTFPERVAPLVIQSVQASDTTITATLANNNIQVSKDLRFPTPMLVEMEATLDVDILTAGNVYSVQISAPGAQSVDGSTLTIPKAVGGGQVGRLSLAVAYSAILPAGYNGANFLFQVGHVSGSAADAVAKATNTRAKWTLTAL